MLESIKTKIRTMATIHRPTLRGFMLTMGVGIGISMVLLVLMSYIETGSWYQSAEAVRPFEGWKRCPC